MFTRVCRSLSWNTAIVAGLTILVAAGLQARTLDNQSITLRADGGSWALNLTTGAAWTATANAPFLHIAGSASGTGNATILFSADPWSGSASRTGSLTVAGLPVAVTQLPAHAKVPGSAGLAGAFGFGTGTPLVAVDGSGNVFFNEFDTGWIAEWNATTHKTSTIISLISTPGGLGMPGRS